MDGMTETEDAKPVQGSLSLRQVRQWHKTACDADSVWWDRAEEDERFRAHDQFTDKERALFKKRHQAPTQFNRIARDVNIQHGRQIKHRMKPVARPRGTSDVAKSRALTDLMEYYWQYNRGNFEQSQAVSDQLTVRGWLEYSLQREDISREPIRIRHVPWREIKIDPASRRLDLSDAANLFRERWVPLDTAEIFYPEKAAELKAYAGRANTYGNTVIQHQTHPTDSYRDGSDGVEYVNKDRNAVRIVECWYRRTVMATHVKQLDGTVTTLMPGMPIDVNALMQPGAQVVQGPTSRIYYVYFCGDVILEQGPSPYAHSFYPYVPYHAFRANVSKPTEVVAPGEPFGMVRLAKDAQRVINFNWSAVQRMLKSRATTYKKGKISAEDLKALVNDPQALIGVQDHDDVKFHEWTSNASALTSLLPLAEDQLQASTGVNEASRGDGPESSGRAIMARQVQSETANAVLVDNQRFAVNLGGWILAALILQTVTAEKVVRITEDVGDRMVAINVTDPYKAAEFKAQGIEVVDSLSGLEYDVEIDEAEADLARRDADREVLMQLVQGVPDGALWFGDLIAESLETRHREKIAERFGAMQQMTIGMQQQQQEQQAMQAQQAQGNKEREMAMRQQQQSNAHETNMLNAQTKAQSSQQAAMQDLANQAQAYGAQQM